MWTGDASFLAANYAALKTKTLEKYARSDGLINHQTGLAQDTPVVVSPYQYRDGYDLQTYPSSVNAQYYRALVLVSKIAAVLGKTSDAAAYTSRQRPSTSFRPRTTTAPTAPTRIRLARPTTLCTRARIPRATDIVPSDKVASVALQSPRDGVWSVRRAVRHQSLYKADEGTTR